MKFVYESEIAASAERVFAFHERPDAFALLLPPWQRVEVITPPSSLAVGTRVELRMRLFGVWVDYEAEHVAYEPGRMFADVQLKGPFHSWLHTHVVSPTGAHSCKLSDQIELELRGGLLGRIGEPVARRQLAKLFAHRHAITRREA